MEKKINIVICVIRFYYYQRFQVEHSNTWSETLAKLNDFVESRLQCDDVA